MRVISIKQWVIGTFAALLAVIGGPAVAWTDKPVRLVVPAPPGGSSDVLARVVAEQLSAQIGQPVIVDNKPGGGGMIAVQAMLSAPADGQTLVVGPQSLMTEIPLVLKLSFDPLKEMKPVAEMARGSLVFVANPTLPASNLKELIAYAKANPGKLNYASYSPGTASHYAGLVLNQKAGIDLLHVPYKGSPPALTDVVSGEVQLMFDGMLTSLPLIKSGKIKAIAVTGSSRSALLPQVPTFAELGYPDVTFTNWLGAFASAKMTPELLAKINAEIGKAVSDPKVRARLADLGLEQARPSTPTQLLQSVQTDYARNAGIVKAFNIKLD